MNNNLEQIILMGKAAGSQFIIQASSQVPFPWSPMIYTVIIEGLVNKT